MPRFDQLFKTRGLSSKSVRKGDDFGRFKFSVPDHIFKVKSTRFVKKVLLCGLFDITTIFVKLKIFGIFAIFCAFPPGLLENAITQDAPDIIWDTNGCDNYTKLVGQMPRLRRQENWYRFGHFFFSRGGNSEFIWRGGGGGLLQIYLTGGGGGGGGALVFDRIPLAKEILVENIHLAKENFLVMSPSWCDF